jgi:hypothetical protein
MDRNDLLSATRAEYLRGFLQSVDQAFPRSVEGLYQKAASSYSSLDQVRYLDARSILMERDTELHANLQKSMEQLLNRSMQTTYSTFRPSFSSSLGAGGLSLVDSTAFEDELRIGEITSRFRGEAEEQLRDLNIRIALLFEQDNIKERENPFRPYLLSRSIATAIDSMAISVDLTGMLLTELAENMAPHVAGIYDAVNAHLAGHGIAAQLQLKMKRPPIQDKAPPEAEQASPEQMDEESEGPFERRPDARSGAGEAARARFDPRAGATDAPKRTVDQLLDLVRGMAEISSGDGMPGAPGQGQRQYGAMNQLSNPTQGQGGEGGAAEEYGGANSHSGGSIQSGSYYSSQEPGQGPGRADGSRAAAGKGIAKAGWLVGKQVVGEVLRKFFASEGAPAGNDAGPAGASTLRQATAQLASSVDQLIRDRTPDSAGMLADDGKIRNLVLEQRANLNSMTEDVDEQMTIDIVAMLFEFILRDTQVPAEVRAQLGRLQFLVLKIALLDTSLLTQKGHPARLLVNRIGSISLGLKQVDPSGIRITAEVCRIVETLLNDGNRGSNLFLSMLDDFDAFIANELRASDEKVERAVQVVEKAQGRTLRFVHATAKMNEALAGLSIDPYLHDFFVNSWVYVLERSERTAPGLAKRFRLLVPDLLWSIVPKVQEQDRTQLFALLPIILATLREGLGFTDQTAGRQQALLDWLVDAHTSALRSGNVALPVLSLAAIHQHFEKFIANPEAELVPGDDNRNPEQYRQFLDESIKELDVQIQLLDTVLGQDQAGPDADGVGAAAPSAQAQESVDSVMDRLRSGVAIEINLAGTPSLGHLNWISANAANMVLTLDQQSAPSMISVRMFLRMYNSGRVRFLETAPLFERAVASLLQSADKMDRKLVA